MEAQEKLQEKNEIQEHIQHCQSAKGFHVGEVVNAAVPSIDSIVVIPTSLKKKKTYLIVKGCFDFVSSMIASVLLLIPLVILSFIILIKDFGNPFYMQKRMGKDGEILRVAKLRSMKKGADHLEEMLTPEQLEEYHHEYKLSDDPRLIGYRKPGDSRKCFGGMIRRMSLDELPQIVWNICIKGNMSIVGPRPILQDELEQNYTIAEQVELLSVKPGLTGYWQAYARNNATYKTGERQKMELFYVRNQCLWLDIKILCATVGTIITKQGAK